MRKYIITLIILFPIFTAFAQQGGYLNSLSIKTGQTLEFHISTSSSTYRIHISKLGTNAGHVYTSPIIQGGVQAVPSNAYSNGCNWPVSFSLTIPNNWEPGVYSATFPVTSGYGTIVFTVRSQIAGNYSNVLVVISNNTMQAYNNFGGKSLYDFNSSNSKKAEKVSFMRPYTEGAQYDYYQWADELLNWMDSKNIQPEVAADYDLEKNPELLSNYDVVMFVGHDEYWSLGERNQVQNFVDNGGRLMILSGNTCWWQVRFENNFNTMVCYKDASADPLTGVNNSQVTVNWYNSPVNDPENRLTGVSFKEGGYVNSGKIFPQSDGYGGYTAYNTQSWIYKGTGLKDGDVFGQSSPIVGYETDGNDFLWKNGLPYVTGSNNTPTNFQIFGLSPAAEHDGFINTHAVMGIYFKSNGGAVFTASTTDWAHGLNSDSVVSKITLNILNKFITKSYPPDIISWSPTISYADSINHENVFVSNRDSILCTSDSLKFLVHAVDPYGGKLTYNWKINNISTIGDSIFIFRNNQLSGLKKITVYINNSYDTTTLSWKVYAVNNKPQLFTVQGSVNYDNSSSSAMRGVKLTLTQTDGSNIYIDSTDNNGNYSFTNISNGNYKLTASSTKAFPSDGVNSLDALLVAKDFVGLTTLSGLPKLAGDVNSDSSLNSLDALMIAQRYVGLINSYTSSDWQFETKTLVVNNSNLSNVDLKGITSGDVDQSVLSTFYKSEAESSCELNNSGSVKVNSDGTVVIPVIVSEDISTSAFGLKLKYASEKFDFVSLQSKASNIISYEKDGNLNVAWIDLSGGKNPLSLSKGESIIDIKFKLKDKTLNSDITPLSLSTGSIFADADGNIEKKVELSSPSIVGNLPKSYSMEQNYPNPFNPSTEIEFSLPESGRISLNVYNVIGQKVSTLINGVMEAGTHKVMFNGNNLPSGIYFYRLQTDKTNIVKKMIMTK